MLRLSELLTASGPALRVEGRLTAGEADLLRAAWHAQPERALELSWVTFADDQGASVLAELSRVGARLLNVPPLVAVLLEKGVNVMPTSGAPVSASAVATLDPARPVDESNGAWLAALRAGDDDAFERLVRANIGCLLAVARRLLRDPRDAEEVVQEAFISALRALPRFRAECRVSTWLHRIVVNHALMRLRARRRRPELPIDTLLPIFTADGRRVEPADVPDPERALAAAETRQAVRAAIDRLPDAYRTVLILRDIEELDTPTVAAQLGITANAVKIRLHRARQALMTLMSPVGLRSATFVAKPPRAAGAAAC